MNEFSSSSASNGNENQVRAPILKVIGLGGGGQNAVDRMIELGLSGIEFIAANSDAQVLKTSQAPVKFNLVQNVPAVSALVAILRLARKAAEESYADLERRLPGLIWCF